ncbi:hypothetical protein NIES2100_62470 [Calothrix sp. NIES-2100]|uniref:toxin HicA n=1 Tax=Calothrix sp. NIES-2100 TaxID=1954172 RepID=UPI000B6228FB|nr:hypothetical protein NIES2100_62470 [Calothrix sp. NIES-2100]
MSQPDPILAKILAGTADTAIPFAQLWQLLNRLGFDEQIRGGHYIFTKKGIAEILNLQHKNGKAKAYQVKLVRSVILKYQIGIKHEVSV